MDYAKIGASLAAAHDELQRRGRAGLAVHARHLGLVSVEPVAKPPRVTVFVECAEDASLDHLGDVGLEMNQRGGGVRTGIVPLEGLDALSEDPAVVRVVAARRLRPLLDVAVPKVGVTTFRQASGLNGSGVVVGVVDTGLQSSHPSFEGRVLRVWDQTLPGPGVAEGAYGAELTGDLLSVSADVVGHGTHVSGIAAGNDPTYVGVAPAADLVMVKTDMLTTHIADGVRYVFRVAADLGRPAVVNLSLGGHDDPHDGTDPMSAVVDAQSGPGRVVCCAAGNDGDDNVHAQVEVASGHTRSIACALPAPAPGQAPGAALFTGWYGGGDEMEVAVVAPAGAQTAFQPVIATGNPVRSYTLADGAVTVTTPGPDPVNGDHNFVVQIEPAAPVAAGRPRPGAWRIRLKGVRTATGRVDVWTVDKQTAQFTGRAVKDSMKVGAPAAATRAVSVAAYTTRNEWEDVLGNPHEAGLTVDDISDFSSEGPRRDGAEKPDVTAPGAMIVSALSDHAPTALDELIDIVNTIMAGTSMASPFVAGLVALLLERNPQLGPESVKELLRGHCTVPGRPLGTFDPKWGYGLLDASGLVVPT